MGSSALLLEWKQPQEINGVLTGYRIYSQQVTEGSELGPIQERQPRIMKDTTGRAKLAGLKPHSKYRVTIKATTNAGEGIEPTQLLNVTLNLSHIEDHQILKL